MSAKLTKEISTTVEQLQLISLDSAAGLLGLSIWTLRQWAQAGKITSYKLGRRRLVAFSDIEALVSQARQPATSKK